MDQSHAELYTLGCRLYIALGNILKSVEKSVPKTFSSISKEQREAEIADILRRTHEYIPSSYQRDATLKQEQDKRDYIDRLEKENALLKVQVDRTLVSIKPEAYDKRLNELNDQLERARTLFGVLFKPIEEAGIPAALTNELVGKKYKFLYELADKNIAEIIPINKPYGSKHRRLMRDQLMQIFSSLDEYLK
jgi:hypothetical protein